MEAVSDLTLKEEYITEADYQRFVSCFKRFMKGNDCKYCNHHYNTHVGATTQPHFFKHVEANDDQRFLHRRKSDDTYLTKMVVSRNYELKKLFCGKCAKDIGTEQILCYFMRYGVGEVIGDYFYG